MMSIRGTFRDGCAQPEEAAEGRDGQPVIISFLEEAEAAPSATEEDAAWDEFLRVLDESEVDTGIPDLAHQHEHYLYGTPKQPPPTE
jgi:hypothetical protein